MHQNFINRVAEKRNCQIKLKNPSFANTNAEIAELLGCSTYTSTVGDVIHESGKWLAINEDDHAAQLRKNRHLKQTQDITHNYWLLVTQFPTCVTVLYTVSRYNGQKLPKHSCRYRQSWLYLTLDFAFT